MKTQTKTEVRNSTAKALKLLRGIDNEAQLIKKEQVKLDSRVKNLSQSASEISKIISGISNAALSSTEAPAKKLESVKAAKAPKPEKAAKPAKPAKVAKPAKAPKAAKPAKPAKPAKVAKPEKAAKAPKPEKAAAAPKAEKAAKPDANRPALKDVAVSILKESGKSMTASDIYREATKRHGYWSRQSLYNVLDKGGFVKSGDGAKAVFSVPGAESTTDEEADQFISKVNGDPSISAVS